LNFIQESPQKQSEKNVFTGRVASPWALLAHDRFSRSTGHHTHLLPELGLSLLHGGHEHVADTSGGQTVKATADSVDGDHVQVLGSGVVGTVHHGAHGQTEGDAELASRGTSTSWMRPKNRGLLVLHTTTSTLHIRRVTFRTLSGAVRSDFYLSSTFCCSRTGYSKIIR